MATQARDRRRRQDDLVLAPGYSATVLGMAGLVSYWRLGEPSGTNAADAVGPNPGTYVGSPTLGAAGAIAGDADTAVLLNGTSQYVTIAANASLNLSTALSVVAWVYSIDATNNGCIFEKTVGGVVNTQFSILGYFGVGTIFFRLVKGAANKDTGITAPSINAWHCVVGTYDGTTNRMYIDAVVTGTPLAVASPIDSGSGISLIGNDGASERFKGRIDEVAIFNRALTPAEITTLYGFHV